jgi:hypothetical protein
MQTHYGDFPWSEYMATPLTVGPYLWRYTVMADTRLLHKIAVQLIDRQGITLDDFPGSPAEKVTLEDVCSRRILQVLIECVRDRKPRTLGQMVFEAVELSALRTSLRKIEMPAKVSTSPRATLRHLVIVILIDEIKQELIHRHRMEILDPGFHIRMRPQPHVEGASL